MRKLEQVGPYTLLSPLGAGAQSRVWLASAGRDGTRLALKLARPGDEAGRARLMREVDIAGGLNHPNVVRIDECGGSGGAVWITMEVLAGPHTPLTLSHFRQLLLALIHVHANSVVHCDIKPANLLLGADGVLRLADFGIARREGQGASAAHGTPHYMPPEQLRGQPLDLRADIFSAGVVLYQILTGNRPFEGTPFEVMQHILHGTHADPSIVMPGLGPSFDEVIRRALARGRDERFGSGVEFLSAFDHACQHGRVSFFS